jgi:polyphosphate kinase
VSDRIRVISIVGRFLEHSRVYCFLNNGDWDAYIGSADWMPRNLDRRIEAAAPVEALAHRQTLLGVLELMLEDNRQAWDLQPDGTYMQRRPAEGEPERSAQVMLMNAEHPRT